MTEQERPSQGQNPIIHEGAPADDRYDGNERADEQAEIRQPSGEVLSRRGERPTGEHAGEEDEK